MSYLTREELTTTIAQRDQTIANLQAEVDGLQYTIVQMQASVSLKDASIAEKDAIINKYYKIRDHITEDISGNYLALTQFIEETDPSQIGG